MPVEIKELVIRTVVSSSPAPSGDDPQPQPATPHAAAAASTEEIVQECVRQVLRILDRRKER